MMRNRAFFMGFPARNLFCTEIALEQCLRAVCGHHGLTKAWNGLGTSLAVASLTGATMKNQVSKRAILFCLAISLIGWTFSVSAQQSRQFSAAPSTSIEPLRGQIDWPSGALENWDGPVVLFLSAAVPSDRDGWMVRAMETVWGDRLPLKELSAALVKEGVAVIRFDNPGVLPPQKRCRQNVLKRGITERTLRNRCMDVEVVGRFTPERYWEAIEHMLPEVQNLMPAGRDKLFLFGFSEGLMHAAVLADRGHVKPRGFISLGSPAEKMETIAHWQANGRITENLDKFDANADSVVTNEEIKQGYKTGLNNFMSVDGWLSHSGEWNSRNRYLLAKRSELYYEEIMEYFRDVSGAGGLRWMLQANGMRVPDATDATMQFYFYGQTSPAEVMQRRRIPGLFIWGDKDRQVCVDRQVVLADRANSEGADLVYLRFPDRYHLLSKRKDFDWLEKGFMPVIAKEVSAFLSSRL